MKKAVVALLGLVLAASAQPAHAAPSYVPTIAWHTCPRSSLQCGTLAVPLDHANPDGPKITLALTRRLHTVPDAQYQGAIVLNPGGPGASGTYLPALAQYVPGTIANAYDWVGFDPRGVGDSVPSLHCGPHFFTPPRKSYVPSSKSILRYWRTRTARLAQQCGRNGGALLDHVKTTDTVADLEDIRVALGQDKLNYYGFSYGTYIGQVYATLHPDRVRRMVLDGVVDPTRGGYQAYGADQDRAAEKGIGVFYRWVAKHDRVYHLGKRWRTVRAAYRAELRKAANAPWHHRLGPSDITDALISAAYYASEWPDVAGALSRLHRDGNGAAMYALYREGDVSDDNGYAVYLATSCTDDSSWPTRFTTYVRDARRLNKRAGFLTWSNTWYGAACRAWPGAKGTPVAVSGAAVSSKILLINETLDSATPFSGALTTRRLFPTASLVAGIDGTTHASSLSGVACVDDTIAQYLADGSTPARTAGDGYDLGCPKVQPPRATYRSTGRAALSLHHGMQTNPRFPR